MSRLGLAYIATSLSIAQDIARSGSMVTDLVEVDGQKEHGFTFGDDLEAVINDAEGVVLKIDLNDVLDVVDVVDSENPRCSSHAKAALGCERFEVSAGHISFIDGIDDTFRPLSQVFDTIDQTRDNGYGVEIEEEDGDIPGTGDDEDVCETVSDDTPATDTPVIAETPAAPKKVYDTPLVPRGQWFKQMREKGLLTPRQPKAKSPPVEEPKTADVVELKSARTPQQLAAIRGYYARRNRQKAA
ncbi:hypothetical protein [Microvirga massiliensis]|uniref:hypothetical protein n=1 Tax=Microvirga massiliensis TaxID=1033741 RepID=UPI0011CA819A|nr:hypothetical protein [Microvirga massiliensis]